MSGKVAQDPCNSQLGFRARGGRGDSCWPSPRLPGGLTPHLLRSLQEAPAMRPALLALLLLLLPSCLPGARGGLREDLGLLRTQLALRLYRDTAAAPSNGTNVVISPAGVSLALEILQFAAQGDTARQLVQALGYSLHGKRPAPRVGAWVPGPEPSSSR